MRILGIETSCDETAASVVEDGTKIISSSLASSLPLHANTGGIIPEVAAREQTKAIIPVISDTLKKSGTIDAIAVTFGPGLQGSLMIGVEAAKALSYAWGKPIVPVNHLIAHIYSAWIENPIPPKFPLIALVVSGGHTELIYMAAHGKYKSLGGTRDDAAGEAFDKIARVLQLGYPGGPAIENAGQGGSSSKYAFPSPLINSTDYDFSFSGLKTAVVDRVARMEKNQLETDVNDIAASVQEAVVDVLISKAQKAASNFGAKAVVFGGGVSANKLLREGALKTFTVPVFFPPLDLSVDNASMVAATAYFNYSPLDWRKISTDPSILL
jgi:N6-L-threonylcarbamoyladenine synthase